MHLDIFITIVGLLVGVGILVLALVKKDIGGRPDLISMGMVIIVLFIIGIVVSII